MNMELEVPEKVYFKAYIIHYHGPISFVAIEVKEFLSLQMSRAMAEKCCFIIIFNFYGCQTFP
jgi:hypothetical protein